MENILPDSTETTPTETAPLRALKTRGRRPFSPTPEHGNHVKLLACLGVTQEQIAKSLGVTVPTLSKHFHNELNLSSIDANSCVISSLVQLAADRQPGAGAILWAKTRRGYRPAVAPYRHVVKTPEPSPENPTPFIWRTIRRKRATHAKI
jgi:hypothetical protein